ncbi:MAG: D-alanyl-D-alanine carboxypeptidase [Syntrophomonadaceae bacterium]|nr:D-alanyl-D-alanine carboxypeptidase [Syntrophomonadaceae bacterium]
MKKLARFLCCLMIATSLLLFDINFAYASSDFPNTNGKAVILMDFSSGRVLYERNSNQQLPPASLTKIMTGLLVVENGNLDQKVIISEYAASIPESTVYLEPNEILTRMELLYAAMLPSANDACTALAESIAGSEAAFINKMNRRVQQLGLKNTNFVNPHGLHDQEHYSTAYDLAMITREALKNPVFTEVVSTKRTVIPWESREDEDRILLNQNRLLSRYEGAIGVKTGYTKQAGNCVVGAAQRGSTILIAVSMNSPTVYDDLQQMLDYGFNNYKTLTVGNAEEISGEIKVKGGEFPTVKVEPKEELKVAVTDEEALYLTYIVNFESGVQAPIKKGDVLGTCELYIKDNHIKSIDMIASQNIDIKQSVIKTIVSSSQESLSSKWSTILGLAVLFIGYLNRKKLEDGLKRVLLYLLRNHIPNQTKKF